MELLLAPITIFAAYPFLGLGVSIFFAVGTMNKKYKSRAKVLFGLCAVLWLSFNALNYYLLLWRSPSGDTAIRVDLVIFGPIMIIITIIGTILLFKGRIKNNT